MDLTNFINNKRITEDYVNFYYGLMEGVEYLSALYHGGIDSALYNIFKIKVLYVEDLTARDCSYILCNSKNQYIFVSSIYDNIIELFNQNIDFFYNDFEL